MSDPVQCAVSYPAAPFIAVSIQTAAGFPVTLPDQPGPEVETNDPVSVTVEFLNGGPAQVIVLPATGPRGQKGDTGNQGADGPAGPAGTGKTWVAITQAGYAALSIAEQNDPTKVYDITDFTW